MKTFFFVDVFDLGNSLTHSLILLGGDCNGNNEQLKNMSSSQLCSLQTLNCRPKPPLPAQYSTAVARRRTVYVACGGGSSRASTRNTDDYHATLKALNSKGRFPRKSLGQV